MVIDTVKGQKFPRFLVYDIIRRVLDSFVILIIIKIYFRPCVFVFKGTRLFYCLPHPASPPGIRFNLSRIRSLIPRESVLEEQLVTSLLLFQASDGCKQGGTISSDNPINPTLSYPHHKQHSESFIEKKYVYQWEPRL